MDDIRARNVGSKGTPAGGGHPFISNGVLALSFLVVMMGCARTQLKGAGPGNLVAASDQKEIEIGNQIHNQIVSSFYLYTEPRLGKYVNRVGSALASHAERKGIPYRFTILYSDKVFATSAPGGYVYLTTGLLDFLESEAELAGVLAHEIGQLQYRNPRLSGSKRALEALTTGGALVGGLFGDIGTLAVLGLAAIDAMTDEKPKEDRVYLADRLALEYMAQSRYDPESWMDVLYRISRTTDQNFIALLDYCSSRPVSGERLEKMRKHFQTLDLEGRNFETRRKAYLGVTKGVREIYQAAPSV